MDKIENKRFFSKEENLLFSLCEKRRKEIYKSEKLLACAEKIVYDCLSLDPK